MALRPRRRCPRPAARSRRARASSSFVDRQKPVVEGEPEQGHAGAVGAVPESAVLALQLMKFADFGAIPFLPRIVVTLKERLRHVIAEIFGVMTGIAILEIVEQSFETRLELLGFLGARDGA